MRLTKTLLYRFCNIMEVKTPVYLLQPRRYEIETTVVANQQGMYQFQESIFHLQGGGQPNDKGWLELQGEKIQIVGGVNERQTGRLMYKLGSEANIPVGTQVKMIVDPAIRDTHMKIHSAGHLIDLAVQRLKYQWTAGKGYHFMEGSYVEYKGVAENPEKAMNDLNQELKNIVNEKIQAENKVYSYAEAVGEKIIPEDFKVSYVRVIGFDKCSCPCGGTHVNNSGEFESIVVSKVQKKGKNVRVMYKAV